MLKPLGNRVLVTPTPAETQSAGGIHFPQTWGEDPAMTGTVVRCGRGPASAQRVRQATIRACIEIVREAADRVPAEALVAEVDDALGRYLCEEADDSDLGPGDFVAFAYTAGHALTVDGEDYLVLQEDDIQAVWSPDDDKECAA